MSDKKEEGQAMSVDFKAANQRLEVLLVEMQEDSKSKMNRIIFLEDAIKMILKL